jgi:hypothetical protein
MPSTVLCAYIYVICFVVLPVCVWRSCCSLLVVCYSLACVAWCSNRHDPTRCDDSTQRSLPSMLLPLVLCMGCLLESCRTLAWLALPCLGVSCVSWLCLSCVSCVSWLCLSCVSCVSCLSCWPCVSCLSCLSLDTVLCTVLCSIPCCTLCHALYCAPCSALLGCAVQCTGPGNINPDKPGQGGGWKRAPFTAR